MFPNVKLAWLDMQAMTLMLPRQPDCPDRKSEAKSTLEGKLDCMSLNGYGSTARDNVDLNRCAAAVVIAKRHALVSLFASPWTAHQVGTTGHIFDVLRALVSAVLWEHSLDHQDFVVHG